MARVLLVRHAHAGVRGTWPGDDLDRPLSDLGRRETAGVTDALAHEPVDAVVTSGARRCVQTVEPLASKLGLDVTLADALAEGHPVETTLDYLTRLPDTTVACSHGEVIGTVVEALAAAGVPLDGPMQWPKASTWELTVVDHVVRSGTYHPPPEV